ncbi:zinc finger BED domain-containing protein RICESLEEPER 2-like protein [Tanacetum coccineum]
MFHDRLARKNLVSDDPNDHWETIELVSEMLGVFKNDTTLLSGVYYPTSCASNIHSMHQEASLSSRGSNESKQMYNILVSENRKRARGNTPSSELGRYGASDFLGQMSIEEFEDLDILGWWKARESQFPILAAMARDLLSVQESTVPFESAFSVSGRVISPRRIKLTPTSVEVCICFKHHLNNIERIQHISPLKGEFERMEE